MLVNPAGSDGPASKLWTAVAEPRSRSASTCQPIPASPGEVQVIVAGDPSASDSPPLGNVIAGEFAMPTAAWDFRIAVTCPLPAPWRSVAA